MSELIDQFGKLSFRPEPIILDIHKLRLSRQEDNYDAVFNKLKSKITLTSNDCNKKEYDHIVKSLALDIDKMDDTSLKLLSRCIAKKSTRQCSFDEKIIIDTISSFLQNNYQAYKIFRTNKVMYYLNNDGSISNDGDKFPNMKSFDAKLTYNGIDHGWISIKTIFGKGGHQDNVFIELHTLIQFCNKHVKQQYIIIIIETDSINKLDQLRSKITNEKILVLDHVGFQNLFINNKI